MIYFHIKNKKNLSKKVDGSMYYGGGTKFKSPQIKSAIGKMFRKPMLSKRYLSCYCIKTYI